MKTLPWLLTVSMAMYLLFVGCARIMPSGKSTSSGSEVLGIDTRLFAAIASNDVALLQECLRRGADPNAIQTNGVAALRLSAMYQRPMIMRLLLEGGADPNQVTDYSTALMEASLRGSAACVRILLEHGAALDVADRCGSTSLSMASRYGSPEVVQLLVDHGASVITTNMLTDLTPIEEASQRDHQEVVNILLKAMRQQASKLSSTNSPSSQPVDSPKQPEKK